MAKHGRHGVNGDEGGRPSRAGYAESMRPKQPRHAKQQDASSIDKPALSLPVVPTPIQSTAPSPSPEASPYARGNYGSGATGPNARTASRSGVGKRVALVAGCFAAGVLIALAAYALWFSTALNDALAPPAETLEAVDGALAEASLQEPFYMLLLGSDSREGSGTSANVTEQGDQERSDVIMLARIDAPNKQVTLVTIPRDTPYTMPDGQVQKINEAYNAGGPALSIKAVSELTGVPIAHYATVHISELEAIVDALGGIEVKVDRKLTVKDALTGEKIVIPEGAQTLNGQQAQAFVRARHEYNKEGESQDGSRQSNVRTFTQALVKKILDRPVIELPGVILDLARYVETDLTAGDLVTLGMAFSGGGLTMYSCTGPTEGYTAEEYGGIWLCYPNPEGWAELMRQVDAGLEPTSIDYESTQIVPDSV